MIFTFLDFISESKALGLPFYFSKKLSDFLFDITRNTNDKEVINLIYHILDQESKSEISSNFTFLDMSEKNDMVSFVQSNRIFQIYKNSGSAKNYLDWIKHEKVQSSSEIWKSDLRSEARIGKTFKRVMSDGGKNFHDSIIERFVNLYKSTFDFKFNVDGRFELVIGEKIRHFYLESNYSGRGGQLSNSCMRYKSCQEFFDIYTSNPEVCRMLVLYSSPDREKISGRALIWKCVDGNTYVDRVYTNDDSDINLFYAYAKSQNWDRQWNYDRKVQLKNWEFDYYPYMDTFSVLDGSGTLFADRNVWDLELAKGNSKVLLLHQTNGTSLDSESVVWSDYSDQYILRNNAIYIEGHDDWIPSDSAIYLAYRGEYVHPNETVYWSDYYQDYIHQDDFVRSIYLSDNIFISRSEKIAISSKRGRITYDHVPDDIKNLLIKVISHDPNSGDDIFLTSLPNFTIINPISGNRYLLNGDVLCYPYENGFITKSDSSEDIGNMKWVSTIDYVSKFPIKTTKSIDDVKRYILDKSIDQEIYDSRILQIKNVLSDGWNPSFRRSPLNSLTDRFSRDEIFEIIKKCLINYDLSIKFKPCDLTGSNQDITLLLNEFIKRNNDPISDRLTANSISKAYLLSEYLISDIFTNRDIMIAWYKEIVFKQN